MFHLRSFILPIALIVSLFSTSAHASDTAQWSLGFGVTTSFFRLGTSITNPFIPAAPAAPSPIFGLERRLSSRAWLTLGVDATWTESDGTLRAVDMHSSSFRTASLAAGVRYVLAPEAIVVPSVIGRAVVGYAFAGTQLTGVPLATPGLRDFDARGESLAGGLDLGFALERELLQGLSIRGTAVIGRAIWTHSWGRNDLTISPQESSDAFQAELTIQPSLELRFYF